MKYSYKRSHSLVTGLLCTVLGIINLVLDHNALVLLAKDHRLIINGFILIVAGIFNLGVWSKRPSEK